MKKNCKTVKIYQDRLKNNPVDHPAHYTSHPSGIEAIEVCGEMGFCLGNAFKYLFRMENKWNPLEDLKKARWYVDREAFQRGHKFNASAKELLHWEERWVDWREDPNCLINRIVGATPGNIEKALSYIYEADIFTGSPCPNLSLARYYINREIKRRSRTENKQKKGSK
jgi:hypothetical protein